MRSRDLYKYHEMLHVLAVLSTAASPSPYLQPFPGCQGGTLVGCPSVLNTTVSHWTQNVDHFDWSTPIGSKATYQQRCKSSC